MSDIRSFARADGSTIYCHWGLVGCGASTEYAERPGPRGFAPQVAGAARGGTGQTALSHAGVPGMHRLPHPEEQEEGEEEGGDREHDLQLPQHRVHLREGEG